MILARWGLVPFFTKVLKEVKGISISNARSETITKAPTWREPFNEASLPGACLSTFEWPKDGEPPKQPYAFELEQRRTVWVRGSMGGWRHSEQQA